MNLTHLKGIILDYGGTIDTPGIHWSHIFLQAYHSAGIKLSQEGFWPAFAHVEKQLAIKRRIYPSYNFMDTVLEKADLQIKFMRQAGIIKNTNVLDLQDQVGDYCYNYAKAHIESVRSTLEWLKSKYPVALVSNFYGNIQSVLLDFGIIDLFSSIIESSVIGVRKPDPRIFAIAVTALGTTPESTLVVGDSITKDIKPAQQLGCRAIWLRGKGWDDDTTQPDDTMQSISSLNDLRNIL